MSKYLLELGVEELPYELIDSISIQIKENFARKLEENNAQHKSIKTYTTPRRLVFVIEGLNEIQPDTQKTFKGPNLKVAIDENGNYTQAALGFAKKFNAQTSNLREIEENGQKYIALEIFEKGKSLFDIIPEIASECVLKVQGSHFMRWSDFDEKFSRPIRWIVSILDDKEIPIEITGIKSSKRSRAHRFCSDVHPEITNVDSYLDIMYEHNVIVDENQRRNVIIKAVEELAKTINAKVKIEDELLKEVTNIVEWPKPVLGSFASKYLEIPEPVIVTVMASHQRYFPLYDQAGKLLNAFITVANYVGNDTSNIKNGNERVIKARLDDAIFFYNEDIKKPLIQRVDELDGITFQKGLGSVKEKVGRIIKISDEIAKSLGYAQYDETNKNILRTALFCKADLTTSLVFEFTELQGVIGAHYAKLAGETDAVVKGIEEHYYPLAADAMLANGLEGQIVGIADKLDTVCAVFALNKIPSGSADPLGVRRAAIGILQTIIQKKLPLNLMELIDFAIARLDIQIENTEKLKKDIAAFFIQRLKGMLTGKFSNDHIEAILHTPNILNNLSSIYEKLELLNLVCTTEDFDKIVSTHTRISKLVRNSFNISDKYTEFEGYYDTSIRDILSSSTELAANNTHKDILHNSHSNVIREDLFKKDSEDDMYRFLLGLSSKKIISYRIFYDLLVNFVPIIDKFFEDVMVMDENISVRNNRLRLLSEVNKEFLRIADFTKIVKNS